VAKEKSTRRAELVAEKMINRSTNVGIARLAWAEPMGVQVTSSETSANTTAGVGALPEVALPEGAQPAALSWPGVLQKSLRAWQATTGTACCAHSLTTVSGLNSAVGDLEMANESERLIKPLTMREASWLRLFEPTQSIQPWLQTTRSGRVSVPFEKGNLYEVEFGYRADGRIDES
jgi:hypothetical protein